MKTISNIKKTDLNNKELWKYTDFKEFKNSTVKFTPKSKYLNSSINKNEIIIYNGSIIEIAENLKNNIKIISGYKVKIKQNTIFKNPVFIKHFISDGDKNSFLKYKINFEISKNSKVTIINKEIFSINQCINIEFDLLLNDNSNLNLINHSEKPNTKQLLNFSANLNKNAKLTIHPIDINGKLIKNNYFIHLNKEGSECLFNGFSLIDKKEHIDNYIEIYHNNKFTISRLNYKSITKGHGKNILFAKAIIQKDSSNSEAYQKNNNLMLSPTSIIHSNPQLEIYNNDVQCTHGSTTGQLDEDAIFYMRSRGITETQAKRILISGFLNDVINQIELIDIKKYFLKKLDAYLEDVN
tara:strand:+ start:18 stop:1076 length:1059 start_codon:yes stop_codon:yes gene_type:complete